MSFEPREDRRHILAEVGWRAMAGMRDRSIHGYFGVDYDIVRDAVENKVPELRRPVESILVDKPPED